MALAVVTGASGFVGSHLAEALLAHGHEVRCILRATSSTRWIPQDRVEIRRGSLDDPEFLKTSLAGAETVFHVAGAVWAPTEEAYRQANVAATALLAQSVDPGTRRVVLVSSLAAAGPSQAGRPRTEDDLEAPTSPYGRSKLGGEKATLRILGSRATVVRPPAVLGPRDVGFLKLYKLVKAGLIPEVGRRGQEVSLIHIADLIQGILLAAQNKRAAGRVYFISDPAVTTFTQVAQVAAEALGRQAWRMRIPDAVLMPLSTTLKHAMPLVGKVNPFPPDRVRDLLQPAWTCSPARAQRELGFATKVEQRRGITDSVRWCRDQGWL